MQAAVADMEVRLTAQAVQEAAVLRATPARREQLILAAVEEAAEAGNLVALAVLA
jgi:hypothetical protein